MIVPVQSGIITVDRLKPFNLCDLTIEPGNGLSIETQNRKSLMVNVLDLDSFQFIELPTLDAHVLVRDRLTFLDSSGYVFPDVRILREVWLRRNFLSQNWKNAERIYFYGTIFLDGIGGHWVFCLEWKKGFHLWACTYHWLGDLPRGLAAVLKI